jgi:hypothetical protein
VHATNLSPANARLTRCAIWVAALVALFAFRLGFGLCSDFYFEDYTQVFLIGFRYFATGQWPYFGPDVVWTNSEIPGALQGLLVGWPLHVVAIPEAPFVLLNLLSFGSLAWLAWYLTRRLPTIPRWLVWGWLGTLPWTLQYGTQLINTSYVLPAAIVFFIGWFETTPPLRAGLVPRWLAFFCMGAATAWVVQVHMSWPVLLPFVALAWVLAWREGVRAGVIATLALTVGALVPGWALLPTLLHYGLVGGSGGVARNVHFHVVTPYSIVKTVARLLSFASLETARFLGTDTPRRAWFFAEHPWLAPTGLLVLVVGVVQPFWMLREWFRTRSPYREWPWIKLLVVVTVLEVYASYWFTEVPRQARAFYVVAPIGFIYAAYCWTFVDSKRWRIVAAVLLGANIAFHLGLAIVQAPAISLYRHRAIVAEAVRSREPEMIGHRRPFAIGGGPLALTAAGAGYLAVRDLQITASPTKGPLGSVVWQCTVRDTNPEVAYRDIAYSAAYLDAEGGMVEQHNDVVRDMFEPGATVSFAVNDGAVSKRYTRATFTILSAEAIKPVR